MPMRLASAMALILALGISAAPAADTPEQIVAFIVHGLEDGSDGANATARLISASPAIFELKGKAETPFTSQVVFRRESDCVYAMHFADPSTPDKADLATRLDFSKVTGFAVRDENGGPRRFFEAKEGFCFDIAANETCLPGFGNVFARTSNPLPVKATAERMTAAFASFRQFVCPAAP
jgi:hypothetical protein